jgi:DNA polymerase-3 subunit alpha
MAKCITIQLPLHEISAGFLKGLEEIVERNHNQNGERKCELKFTVLDYEDEISLEMFSKSVKVNPDNDFMEDISSLRGIQYKLN